MARVDYRNRRAGVTKLPDGRKRVTRIADVQSELRTDAELDAEVWLPWGTPEELHTGCRLVAQELAPLNDTATTGARVLTRVFEELPATAEIQVGLDSVVVDANGRHVMSREFIQLSAGTFVPGTPGTAVTANSIVYALDTTESTDNGALRSIRRRYVEVTASAVEVGYPLYVRGEDDRKTVRRLFTILPGVSGAEPAALQGVIGVETFDGCVCIDARIEEHSKARVLISKTYAQATASPVQIGDVIVRDLTEEGAFKITEGPVYKPARAYVYRYLVSGASPAEADWLALNTQLASTGRYYTGGGIRIRGAAYSIIEREYTELPDTYTYTVYDRFPFPGTIALRSDGVPYVNSSPVTRVVPVTVVESYHLGEPVATALGYDPQKWTSGTVEYTPTDNNPSNLEGYDDYEFPQCLGTFGTSAFNKYYKGLKCSSVISSFASTPAFKPSGAVIISSVPRRWRGQIWRKTNQTVTF